MKKILEVLYKIMLIIVLVLVLYVTYCSIFKIYQLENELNPLIIILGTIVTFFVFINLKKIVCKIPDKKSNLIAICLSIIFFILLSAFGRRVTSIPTYDLSNIQKEAIIMLQNGGKFVTEDYFNKYINQIPIAVFVYYIYKLGNILNFSNLKLFAIIVNSFFLATTAFFTYATIKKVKDYKSALITLLFFIVNPIFYLYVSYFYADTLCMPFAAISIYLFISALKNNTKKTIIMLSIVGFILALGYEIRVVLAILLVAMVIVIILKRNKSKDFIFCIISLILGFILGIILCKTAISTFDIHENKELEFPITHYLMYGANYESDGRWNIEDYQYTYNSGDYSSKTQNNISKIKERISYLGPSQLITFLKTKLAVNWSNGTYDYLIKLTNVEEINIFYDYVVGNKKIFVIYYCQICKTSILITFLLSIANEIRKKRNEMSIYSTIYIAMFGAFVFYLFWEVLTRYSLTFLPWIMLLFPIGIEEIEKVLDIDKIQLVLKNKNVKLININRIKKIAITVTIFLTICLSVLNYYEYALKKQLVWEKRVMQYSSEQGNLVPKILDKNIQQTFNSSKRFNVIAIKFIKKDIKEETNYVFKLKDSTEKILVEQKFKSSEVKDDKFKIFKFKEIKPKGEQEYTIEIYSTDKNLQNSIGIETFYQEGYDVYPNGNIKINNQEIDADLTFQVAYEINRSCVTKKFYITLSTIIIIIEVFAFYPYLKKKK